MLMKIHMLMKYWNFEVPYLEINPYVCIKKYLCKLTHKSRTACVRSKTCSDCINMYIITYLILYMHLNCLAMHCYMHAEKGGVAYQFRKALQHLAALAGQ